MADPLPVPDVHRDAFLGGKIHILQPVSGYRAGIDPVLLAASIPAKPGDTVLELGCGGGVASFCLAARVPDLMLTGLELQPYYAGLAQKNARENGITFDVVTGDLSDMPDTLRQRQFTHVLANPPYFDRDASTPARDQGREMAMGEATPLSAWVAAAAKRAAPKGTVTFIHRADRLPELLQAMMQHLGSLEVLPLIPRAGKPARLVLIRGQKNGRAAFRLHHGWVLHAGHGHDGDRENYTPPTACILREGAALGFAY